MNNCSNFRGAKKYRDMKKISSENKMEEKVKLLWEEYMCCTQKEVTRVWLGCFI